MTYRSHVIKRTLNLEQQSSMIFPKPLSRVRFWAGVTAVLVLTTLYFFTHYREFLDEEGDIPKSLPVFKWLPIQNITFLDSCRNSQQGDSLIVDELGLYRYQGKGYRVFSPHIIARQRAQAVVYKFYCGLWAVLYISPSLLSYVCPLSRVLKSGCCRVGANSGNIRFECGSCKGTGCCEVYEHCVSCCMHPNKLPLLHRILSQNTESFHPLYSSLKDQFELCLSKCRTSSQSVQHENAYRNPFTKFCYGPDTPTLLSEA